MNEQQRRNDYVNFGHFVTRLNIYFWDSDIERIVLHLVFGFPHTEHIENFIAVSKANYVFQCVQYRSDWMEGLVNMKKKTKDREKLIQDVI